MKLTNGQVLILKALANNPSGLTREQLKENTGVVISNETLGPVLFETRCKHPESLITNGLVQVRQYRPDEPALYFVTDIGGKLANRYSARRTGAEVRIPAEVLNPIVLRVRPLKPYGIENFTDEDVDGIRTELPEEYWSVTIDSLRRQIMNQRKMGAYITNQYTEPEWYQEYRTENEYKVFAGRVRDFYKGCAVCGESQGTDVYHRRFERNGESVLYLERAEDGIELCQRCHKRNWKFLCEIPDECPNPTEDVSDEIIQEEYEEYE